MGERLQIIEREKGGGGGSGEGFQLHIYMTEKKNF